MLDYDYKEENYISFKEVENIWNKNIRDTVLYLNNPFCLKNCNYCCHKGYANPTKSEVEEFYFSYYPRQFEKYKNIIQKQNIKLVSFGGGTPNFLTPKGFEKFLKLLPKKILEIPKIIELHPALISIEYLNILKKYNFNTLIFCIQTFDKKILEEQNRLIHNSSNLFKCFKYAKKLKFNIAVDLITYWKKDDTDWKVLEKDLYILKWLEPDEITISVLYQNKYFNKNFKTLEVYKNILSLVKNILPKYKNEQNDFYKCAPTRFFKENSKIKEIFDIYTNSLSCVPWEHEQQYSTLGIGSYKCKLSDVYSIIGPNYVIYETNDNRYYLAKKYNFWDSIRNVINKLEKETEGLEVPTGTGIVFSNIVENLGVFYKGFVQGDCKTSVIKRLPDGKISELEEKITYDFFNKIPDKYKLI